MRILVTGVAGFLGSTIAKNFLAAHPESQVTGVDDFSFGNRHRISDLGSGFIFYEGSVDQVLPSLDAQPFDLVIHAAAIAPLPHCQADHRQALEQNVANVGSVVDFCLRSGSSNLVFLSSGAIYENVTNFPVAEEGFPPPTLVYPVSKYLAEQYLHAVSRSYGLRILSLRLFNMYGPTQDYFRNNPALISYLIRSLVKQDKATLFGSGEQRRDYVYIDDLVELLFAVAYQAQQGTLPIGHNVLNVASGKSYSVNEIIKTLEGVSGLKLDFVRAPEKGFWSNFPEIQGAKIGLKDQFVTSEVLKETLGNTDKALDIFGWKPKTTLESGLAKCFTEGKKIIMGQSQG